MNNVGSLSVVIPVFNEERALADVLADVREGLAATDIEFEIIVVDDGSQDGSARLLAELATADPRIRVLRHGHNMGKGQALRTGLAVAGGQWILLLDADLQVRLAELPTFRDAARCADVIIGYRQYRKGHPFVRRMISKWYRWLVKTLFALRVRDCGCPFKLIRADVLRTLSLTASGFGFDAELLWKITLAGEKIIELPVLSNERKTGRSKVTALGCLACAWELFRIRFGA